ncbi:VWA domain-containing protein [Brevibacterium album]|uniref:VWA domain-containing protein n=1 Tax=Brevibacterium album TaxID=417948 RepID=UPI000417294D|nr:VWA domain-containing protein [Brevibacterium album]
MNDLVLSPVLPWPVLAGLAGLLLAGCAVLAVRTRGRRLQWSMRGAAVLVLALALLRPGVPVPGVAERAESALDVFVAVDTTASMIAEDWNGDEPRLSGAVEDIRRLMEQAPEARFSLVTFASTAQTVVPLTTDHAAMGSALEVLRPELTLYSSGSSITEPAAHLRTRLEKAAEDRPENARLLFYLGDGEQTSDAEPAPMSDLADLVDGGAVYGYGTEAGGRMLETSSYWDESEPAHIEDPETGEPAVSRIDTAALEEIAGDLGVDFAHREAGTDPGFAFPEADRIVQAREESRAGVAEYTWALFIPLTVWLAAEAVLAARGLRRTGLLSGGRPRAAAPTPAGPRIPGPYGGGPHGGGWGR